MTSSDLESPEEVLESFSRAESSDMSELLQPLFDLDVKIDSVIDTLSTGIFGEKMPFEPVLIQDYDNSALQGKCQSLALELAASADSNRRLYDALYRLTLKFRDLKAQLKPVKELETEMEALQRQQRAFSQLESENEILAKDLQDKQILEVQLKKCQDTVIQQRETIHELLEGKDSRQEEIEALQKRVTAVGEKLAQEQAASSLLIQKHADKERKFSEREQHLMAEIKKYRRHFRSASDDMSSKSSNYFFGAENEATLGTSTNSGNNYLARSSSRKQIVLPEIDENSSSGVRQRSRTFSRMPKSASFANYSSSGIMISPITTSVSSNSMFHSVPKLRDPETEDDDGFDTEDDTDEPDGSPRWVSRPKIDLAVGSTNHRRTRSLMTPGSMVSKMKKSQSFR